MIHQLQSCSASRSIIHGGTWLGKRIRTDGAGHGSCTMQVDPALQATSACSYWQAELLYPRQFVLKCCTCCYLRRCIVYKYFRLAAFGASRQLQCLRGQIKHIPSLQKLISMPTHGDRNFPPLNATHPALFHPCPMLYSRSWIHARANLPRLSYTYNKSNILKIVRFMSFRSHFTSCVLETLRGHVTGRWCLRARLRLLPGCRGFRASTRRVRDSANLHQLPSLEFANQSTLDKHIPRGLNRIGAARAGTLRPANASIIEYNEANKPDPLQFFKNIHQFQGKLKQASKEISETRTDSYHYRVVTTTIHLMQGK